MKDQTDGGPAFPVAEDHRVAADLPWTCGMSLRDYFAAKAMATLLGSEYTSDRGLYEGWSKALAYEAYLIADAMLAAREVNP